jgi:putative transposase
VAIEAIKGLKTLNEIASETGVHPNQISHWKKQASTELPAVFSNRRSQGQKAQDDLTAELYQHIGQLKVELDWLKKNLALPVAAKRALVQPDHREISLARQCDLLGLGRSSWYYQPAQDDPYNEYLMRLMDQQFTETPFYGARRMTAWLRYQGELVNLKRVVPEPCRRVARLMRKMGLQTIYPKPNLSAPAENGRRYPYLLKGMVIAAPNQVWSTDITYLRLPHGFLYLVAILDWFSRYVLAWQVSNTMDVGFCLDALEEALNLGQPQIFNSDQDSQFTSLAFTTRLEQQGIQISPSIRLRDHQDGRGRVFDNIFVERLWRTVKYEEVYLKEYLSVAMALESLRSYFAFYNERRLHQSLNYQPPATIHFGR